MAEGKNACYCACCVFAVASIVTLIVVPQLFKYVGPNQCGIRRDTTSKKIYPEDGLYKAGRHQLGMTAGFYLYPTTVQTAEESLDNVRTNEGYKVKISFAFMYRLVCDDILRIYKEGMNGKKYTKELDHNNNLRQRAKEALKDVVARFPTSAFWERTTEVQEALHEKVCSVVKALYAECFHFQLISYTVDNRMENLIMKEIQAVWAEKTEIAKRAVSQVTTNGKVIESDFNRRVKEVNTQAEVDAKRTAQEAAAAVNLHVKGTQANASLIRRIADGEALVIERTSMLDRTRLISEAEANATVILQTAKSQADNMVLTAKGRAQERIVAAQGLALEYLKTELGLSNNALARYEQIRTLPSVYFGKQVRFGFGPGIIATAV